MSIIMTAGNKKVDWSPKAKSDKAIVKTASTGEEEVQEKDDLFEAAKSVVEKEAGIFGEEEVVLDVETPEVPETNGGFEDAVKEVSEEGAVESVEEAVEAVEEAVEDLKAVVSDEAPEAEAPEAEEAEESEESEEVEIEVVDEEPVSEEGEIIIESEPTCCESCGATMASSGEEFVKYASISPSNRKKLRQYWKGMLNYVPDYVDLMTK